ncbi:hypothetical protein GGI25_001716 [Coemansia spiralis]|uniref:Uncharacterized protein n=2 Tax=Coemansia TaxID=4863 RepID=A0A9W8GC32_9FUNG|nr:hypothetical protein GGI25_001716 [Coemansia spiralis]
MKLISEKHHTPIAQSIALGLCETERVKLAVKQKVAWQQACPKYTSYACFLEQALDRYQPQRLSFILKRMLNEHVQWGKPTNVEPELLDRCAGHLFLSIVDSKATNPANIESTLEAVDYLTEIAWRIRHNFGKHYPLWELVAAVAHDLRDDTKKYKSAVHSLEHAIIRGSRSNVQRMLIQTLGSPRISDQLFADMFSCCISAGEDELEGLLNSSLTSAFYSASLGRGHSKTKGIQEIFNQIKSKLASQYKEILDMLAKHKAEAPLEGTGRVAAALVHLYLSSEGDKLALNLLPFFDRLSVYSKWPMGALSMAVNKLVDGGYRAEACALLQAMLCGDSRQFTQIIGINAVLSDDRAIMLTLVENELAIRLQLHKQLSTALPMTAFFAPSTRLGMCDQDEIANLFKQYYSDIGHILQELDQQSKLKLAKVLVYEASSWGFRMQSPAPIAWLTQILAARLGTLGINELAQLLLEYARILCNFSMIRYVAAEKGHTGITTQTWMHYKHSYYTHTLSASTHIRKTILNEYLRHGISPPPEALALFANNMAVSGESKDAQSVAAIILPQILPQLTGNTQPGRFTIRAYYEWMLYSCRHHGKRLLRLSAHLLGHHGVDSLEFRCRLAELTIYLYLRHRHFYGMGFYQLERIFVRYVDRPRFTSSYLNTMRPRFWALHMFLRRCKYIPRLKLYSRQFRVSAARLYKLQITAIPSKTKMKAQGVDFELKVIDEKDIDTAIKIFMDSIPRNRLGVDRFSVDSVVKKFSKDVMHCHKRN